MVKLELKNGEKLDVKFMSFFRLYLLSLLTISILSYIAGFFLGLILVGLGY